MLKVLNQRCSLSFLSVTLSIAIYFFVCTLSKAQPCPNSNGPELVSNGGFESFLNGFTSAYRPTPYTFFFQTYTIVTEGTIQAAPDANAFKQDFVGKGRGGAGNLLMVNGNTIPNAKVLCTRVNNVIPNTTYFFSVWVSTMSWSSLTPEGVAKLRFSVNNTLMGNRFSSPMTINQWAQFFVPWNSGTATFADICLINENTAPFGNDFALDDISFTTSCQGLANTGPKPALGPDLQVCNSATEITLNPNVPASPNLRYIWSNGATTPAINVTGPGTYVVCVDSAGFGCYKYDSITITPADVPKPVVTPVEVCQNAPAPALSVAAVPLHSTSWYLAATGGSGVTNAPGISTAQAGTQTYYVSYVQDPAFGSCESERVPVEVKVLPLPQVSLPAQYNLCLNDSLMIGPSPTDTYTYLWLGALPIANATEQNMKVRYTQADQAIAHPFSLLITDPVSGCKSDVSTVVNVLPLPDVAPFPPVYETCSGKVITIGTPPVAGHEYQWSPTLGVNDPSSSLTSVTLYSSEIINSPSTFRLTTRSIATGCTRKDSTIVTLKPGPASALPSRYEVCANAEVEVGQGSVNGYSYQWQGNPALQSANQSIAAYKPIGNDQIQKTETLRVTVTETLTGCQTLDSTQIFINPIPQLNLPSQYLLCSNDTIIIGVPFSASYTALWSGTNGLLDLDSSISRFTNVNNSSTALESRAKLSVRNNATGCLAIDSTIIATQPIPGIGLPEKYVMCAGDTVQIGVAGLTANTFQWSNETGLLDPLKALSRFYYTHQDPQPVDITLTLAINQGSGQCSSQESTIVTVNPNPKLTWQTPSSVCQSTQSIPLIATPPNGVFTINGITQTFFTPSLPGAIDVQYQFSNSYGCVGRTNTRITVHPKPVIDFKTVPTLCAGERTVVKLEASPIGGIFKGLYVTNDTLQPVNAGDYEVVYAYTDPYQCTDSSRQTIRINKAPDLSFELQDSVCFGSASLPLIATPVGGVFSGVGVDLRQFKPSVIGNNRIVYTFNDVNGCSANKGQLIFVKPSVTLPVNLGADKALCLGESLQLSTALKGIYDWQPGHYQSNAVEYKPSKTMTYKLTVQDSLRCAYGSDEVIVTVYEPPINPILADSIISCFTNNSVSIDGRNADAYTWHPGNSNSSQLEVFGPGLYILTASTGNVCFTKDSVKVAEACDGTTFVPEAFSPNQDGVNDELHLYGKFITNVLFTIYNRWGEIIYQTDRLPAGWDGVYKNAPMPAGVYPWRLSYSSIKSPEVVTREGSVTLVR